MPFVDTNDLKVVERLPGWKGRYFHSASMTFAHYELASRFVDSRALSSRRRGLRSNRGRTGSDDRWNISDSETRRGCHCACQQSSFRQSIERRAADRCGPRCPSRIR